MKRIKILCLFYFGEKRSTAIDVVGRKCLFYIEFLELTSWNLPTLSTRSKMKCKIANPFLPMQIPATKSCIIFVVAKFISDHQFAVRKGWFIQTPVTRTILDTECHALAHIPHMTAVHCRVTLLHTVYHQSGHQLHLSLLVCVNSHSSAITNHLRLRTSVHFLKPFDTGSGVN